MKALSSIMRLVALLALFALAGCALLPDESDRTRDWSASRLHGEAQAAMSEGRYEDAIDYLEKLQAHFPFGRLALQAQLDLIYAYYRDEQPDSAIAAADRFIRTNPRHPYVDYAYYMKGLVNYYRVSGPIQRLFPPDPAKTDNRLAEQSFNDFAELVRRYPDSEYSEDARERMIFLRNNTAMYEVNVARYYLRRQAYVAAVNRARQVIENFPRTPAVEDALAVSAEAYARMGLMDLANDSHRVLLLNFPSSEHLPAVTAALEGREPPRAPGGGFFSSLFSWFD